ncbi:MAG: saccharopine dehydrogenase, partial [Lewinella sp.]|nr:saccharopine dehydrogenase [Lewinella sp.]
KLSYHNLMEAMAPSGAGSVKERIARLIGEAPESEIMQKLEWLGLFRKKKIGTSNATPAFILEQILLEKWKLAPQDRDMIIMQHEFEYLLEGKHRRLTSSLVMKGEGQMDTAMSRLVGLPMGVFVRLVAEGKIQSKGVHIPVMKEVYEPVLEELKEYGVTFHEEEEILS